jgi:eukaryotic translation initiation factor 2C
MIDKKLYRPAQIDEWAIVVYERQNRFNAESAQTLIRDFISGCNAVGACAFPLLSHV